MGGKRLKKAVFRLSFAEKTVFDEISKKNFLDIKFYRIIFGSQRGDCRKSVSRQF